MDPAAHRIGDWTLDHASLRLLRGAQEHRLPRLQYDLLCVLLEQAGRLVTREALIERAWQRQVVGDEVLSRQIASLRQCLGDDARDPRYIETVPKVGYRLLAAVATLSDAGAAHAPTRVPSDPPATPPPAAAAHPRGGRWAARIGIAIAIGLALAASMLLRRDGPGDPPWSAAALAREQALASDPDLETAPRWSRDGRWLAYVRRAPGAARSSVWWSRSDGSGARHLFEADGVVVALAFAPDATALAFLEHGADGCQVRRHALPDGPQHTLHRCGPGHGLDWSPDGRLLVFSAPEGAPGAESGLVALPLDGAPPRVLTTPAPRTGPDDMPRWSPDGTRLAFARGVEGEQQLLLAGANGSAATRLGIDDRNRIGGLAWSADGAQLLVAMDPSGSPALHAVDAATGARTWLGARGVASLDVAPGAGLVHEARRYDANIWRIALDGGRETRRLSPSTRFDAHPALSPDGTAVAYVSSRDAASSVWVVADDGRETRLALPPDRLWNRPAWSPDGRSLVLTHYVDGGPRAAIHDLASGATRVLDAADVAAAAFAGDGSLLAIARVGGVARIVRWREGEAPVAIPGTEGALEFRTGGRFMAWLTADAPDLRIAALDGPAATDATPPRPAHPGAFAFAGGRLAIVAADAAGDAAVLWRFDPLDAAIESLGSVLLPTANGPALAVDPAWRHAVLARIDALEADLWRTPPP